MAREAECIARGTRHRANAQSLSDCVRKIWSPKKTLAQYCVYVQLRCARVSSDDRRNTRTVMRGWARRSNGTLHARAPAASGVGSLDEKAPGDRVIARIPTSLGTLT